jgi:hypothetical protein
MKLAELKSKGGTMVRIADFTRLGELFIGVFSALNYIRLQ